MNSKCPPVRVFKKLELRVSALKLTLLTLLFTLIPNRVHAQLPTPSIVYNFQGGTGDIYNATGRLAQGRDGDLYGTGTGWGLNHQGGVYKVTPSTGAESLIASFPSTWRGCQGLTLGFDGNFYGTCQQGGANNDGFVFQMTPAGMLTDIYDFTGKNNDATPMTVPVLGANGDLFGTTGCGNIYRVTTKGAYLNIKSGTGYCSPTMLSAGSDGNFYGAWGNDPVYGNLGSVFKVTAAGGYKVVHGFTGSDPSKYPWGVILASNGRLYGADNGGGADSFGAIFDLTAVGKLTDLFDINSTADGVLNLNDLLQASDGYFYGASFGGGPGNGGSFYELTSANAFSVLLLGPNPTAFGQAPATPLMQHTDGSVYGTTSSNGPSGLGALLSFNIGASPFVALVSPVASGLEGSQVQILGQGFDALSVVQFGGTTAATATVTGSTFIQATVPAGALTGTITVKTGGTTLSSLGTFKVLPALKSFSPASGAAGTAVKINGTGLAQTTAVKFNGKAAVFTINSDGQITATVPTGATTGKIAVTTKGGSASSATAFTVN